MAHIDVRIEWSGRHIFGEESIRHAMIQQYGLDFTVSKLPSPAVEKCCCGEPTTLGTVHRTDGPCFVYDKPAPDKCELKLPEKLNEYNVRNSVNGQDAIVVAVNSLIDYLSQKGR